MVLPSLQPRGGGLLSTPYDKWPKRDLIKRLDELERAARLVTREYSAWMDDPEDFPFSRRERLIAALVELRITVER